MCTIKRAAPLLAMVAAVFLSSCVEATLPRFDGGLLNPEIRLLRAGEIVDSVKCAMVAFMHEREQDLLTVREADQSILNTNPKYNGKCPEEEMAKKDPGPDLCQIEGKSFNPYNFSADISVDPDKQLSQRVDFIDEDKKPINPAALRTVCGLNKHWRWNYEKPIWQLQCVENKCDEPLVRRDKNLNYSMGRSLWDYTIIAAKDGGYKEKGCIPVPDYSRLALDPNQSASIQLTLVGTNSGFVNFARIDAKRTGINWILPGNPNAAIAAPFPQLIINPKETITFDVSVVMPQSVHTFNQSAVPSDRAIELDAPKALGEVSKSYPGGPSGSRWSRGPLYAVTPRRRSQVAEKNEEFSSYINTLASLTKKLADGRHQQAGFTPCNNASDCNWPVKREDAARLANWWAGYEKNIEIGEKTIEKACAEARTSKTYQDYMKFIDRRCRVGRDSGIAVDKQACTAARKLDERYKDQKRLIEFGCNMVPKKLYRLAAQLRRKGIDESEASGKKALENKFYEKCNADTSTFAPDNTTRIDFLGLKKLLHNIVEDQDKAIYKGIPAISLSAINLTSAFQLTMEAQAGTSFFKIIPVIAPPNTEIKLDHSHTLKITLNGKKGKGDKLNPKRLADSCRERVGDQAYNAASDGAKTTAVRAAHFCDTAPGQLLESIIQAQEKSGSGGAQ